MRRNNAGSVFFPGIVQFTLVLLFGAGGYTSLAFGQGKADPPGRLFGGPPQHVAHGKYGVSAVAGDIDTEVLNRGLAKLELQLPDGSTVTLERDGLEKRGPGNLAWRGRVVSEPDSRAILTLKHGFVAGKVSIGQELFEIRPYRGRKHMVEQLDPELFPGDIALPVDLPDTAASGSETSRTGFDPMFSTSQPDALGAIDVMVTYSPQARSSAGGEAQVEAQIQSAVDAMNTAFSDSEMVARVRLVHTQEVNHNDSGDIRADLDWASSDSTVAILRDQFGADMVAHIVENGGAYCGIAWVQRNPGPGFAGWAFSVTDRGCLGNSTFAHELGHNLGFEHNPENGGTSEQASYPWSFAHYEFNVFRTIMSYSNPCGSCPRQDYFSNPEVNYGSYPTGIDGERDNARTGDLIAPIVANYRASVIEPSMEIISWVPPYAISQCQAMAEADFGGCDAKDGLTRIGLQFWVPRPDGTIKYADHESYTPTDSDVGWWTNWCGANGIECLLTVYNNNGTWDWDLARSAFASNRTTFVNALVSEMERLGLDGIDVDLEGIGDLESDRAAFDQFIHDLWLELDSRGKVLTINSFHYIWNAPNQNWWSDWVGEVDKIHSMGYEELYEGGSGYHRYSFQQDAGYAAGYTGDAVLMGMPSWLGSWGVSSGRGTSAQAHIQEVRYDLAEPTGIAIWDLQLSAWQDPALWCEIAALKGVAVNLPPSFTADPIVGEDANEGSAYTGTVLDYATDPDNDPLTFSRVDGPSWLLVEGDGTLSGTPGSADVGQSSWTVEVSDGNGGADTAELRVTVIAGNSPPNAVDDTDSCSEDSASLTIDVLANDEDPENDPLEVTGVSGASNGSVSFSTTDVTYVPNLDFNGSDSFTYFIADDNGGSDNATVMVNVLPVNDPPVFSQNQIDGGSAESGEAYSGSLAGTAADPDGGGLTYSKISASGWLNVASNGILSGTPSDLDEGPNSFIVQVSDGTLSDTAELLIDVMIPPPFVDYFSNGQSLTWGSVAGSYTNTHTDDGNVQSITEAVSNGKPTNRVSRLQFEWTFEVESGNAVTLFANAWGSASSDGDQFEFSYSIDGSTFLPLFRIDATTDSGNLLAALLPASTAGTVYVRVEDTDRSKGSTALDTVYVDQIYIRSETTGSGSPPDSPTGLVATAQSSSRIDLNWTDNSLDELGFYVERSLNGTTWSKIRSTAAGVTSISDTGLPSSTTFLYRVRAFNSAGESGYSNVDQALTGDAPSLHVADLEGLAELTSKRWNATVEVLVVDTDGAPVPNAAVSGSWSLGGESNCTTDSNGRCTTTKLRLKIGVASVSFTVDDIVHSALAYDSIANSDLDEDSDGTVITIFQE